MIKQRHVAALLAEFLGTFILAVVVFAVGLYNFLFFTTIAAGATLAILVTAFGPISGSHFNPIITIGLFVIRQITFVRTIAYLCVQFLAGGAAYLLIDKYLKAASPVDQGIQNVTSSGSVDWNIAIAEFLGAFVFAAIVAAIMVNKLKNPPAAGGIGGGLFLGLTFANIAVLVRLSETHTGIINPALSISSGAFDWINTFAAPIVGSVVAMILVAVMLVPVKKLASVKKGASASVATPEVPAVATKAEVKTSAAKKPAAKKATAKKPAAKKSAAKKKTTKK